MRKWLLGAAGVVIVVGTVVVGQALTNGDKGSAPEGTMPQKTAQSRIVKVTVYPNSALITREVEVPEGTGLTELVVSALPPRISMDSLYSEGSDGIRVLSTRFRSREVLEDTRADVRKLEDQMKTMRLAGERLVSEINTFKQNMLMMTKLEDFTTKTTVHSTEKGGLNSDTVITLTKYLMQQREEKAKELVRLEQELQVNKENIEFYKRKMTLLAHGTSKTDRDAIITIDRDQNLKGAKIRLNYLVDAVSWKPQYKLRAGKNGEPVQIDCLASLKQQSGEDWNQVALSLSTTEPMLNAAPPDLKRLEVVVVARNDAPLVAINPPTIPPVNNFAPQPVPLQVPPPPAPVVGNNLAKMQQQIPPPLTPQFAPVVPQPDGFAPQATAMSQLEMANSLRIQALKSYSKQDLAKGEKILNEAAALEQNTDLMKSRQQLQDEQRLQKKNAGLGVGGIQDAPSLTYNLGAKLSVPSRNDDQVVEVAKLKMAPKFYYKAVPVLSRSVYRLADLVNTSNMVLLPGEATMYQGTDFVGRMHMPLVAVGEEFTAGFGVDPQLQIQRQMTDKERKTQGGNQVLRYEYRILVSSYKKENVKVQVWDRLPLSAETESAGVILAKTSPKVSEDALYVREHRPNNLLRWDLTLEPTMNGENALAINYEFRIELDKQKVIANVLSR